jgi:hypothetical protein
MEPIISKLDSEHGVEFPAVEAGDFGVITGRSLLELEPQSIFEKF